MSIRMKVSPHLMSGGAADTLAWLQNATEQTQPALLKLAEIDQDVLRNDELMNALGEAAAVGVPIMGRLAEEPIQLGDGSPYTAADSYAAKFNWYIGAFPMIKYWEGPNEVVVKSSDLMIWYAAFLNQFALRIKQLGRQAGIGAWATGTPELNLWSNYGLALQATVDHNAVLTRHAYGAWNDPWLSLRHRFDETEYNKLGFYKTPLIISECGADWAPWKPEYTSDINRYWLEWLKPYTETLNSDSYVLAATVFTVGNGGSGAWDGFDVAHYNLPKIIANAPPAPPIPAPYKVVSLREADNWLIVFANPNDNAPKARRITWDMDVSYKQATGSTVWLKVNSATEMWVLETQTKRK